MGYVAFNLVSPFVFLSLLQASHTLSSKMEVSVHNTFEFLRLVVSFEQRDLGLVVQN